MIIIFFFAQWQGYNYFIFYCGIDDENPHVYILTDAPVIKLYKEHFTDFIREEGLQPLLNVLKTYKISWMGKRISSLIVLNRIL
jgi:hypothetical protein